MEAEDMDDAAIEPIDGGSPRTLGGPLRQRLLRRVLELRTEAVPVPEATTRAVKELGCRPTDAERWVAELATTEHLYGLMVLEHALSRDARLGARAELLEHIGRRQVSAHLRRKDWEHRTSTRDVRRVEIVKTRWDGEMDHLKTARPLDASATGLDQRGWVRRLCGRYEPSRGLKAHVCNTRMDGDQAIDEVRKRKSWQEMSALELADELDEPRIRPDGTRLGPHPDAGKPPSGLDELGLEVGDDESALETGAQDEHDLTETELRDAIAGLSEIDRQLVLLRYYGVRVPRAEGGFEARFKWPAIYEELTRRGFDVKSESNARQRFSRLTKSKPQLARVAWGPKDDPVPEPHHRLAEARALVQDAESRLDELAADPVGYYAIVSRANPDLEDPLALLHRRHGISVREHELVQRRAELLAPLSDVERRAVDLVAASRKPLPQTRPRTRRGLHRPDA